jgi:pyruvate dehydrogenase E2 component (dihydrolipoamide acetyltransferase)
MPQLLRMPEVAANTTQAVLASWPLQVGAEFRAHDTLATVETAKAVVDIEAERDGVLLATLVAEGTEVDIGAPIALFATGGEQVTDIDAALTALGAERKDRHAQPDAATDVALEIPEADRRPSTPAPEIPPGPVSGNAPVDSPQRIFASPLARRLAREARMSVDDIAGTGPNSRIVRRDVEAAIAKRTDLVGIGLLDKSSPGYVDRPHTPLRRAVAARLLESTRTAPHFYLRGTARVDALTRLRSELNENAPTRVSLTHLIIKAIAHAHALVPEMNVIWRPDAIRSFSSVDVAVAVATDRGLLTPVLRSVESLSVRAIARSMSDLVDRGRNGTLRQHELEGGTITVSNLGMYDTEEFAAVINPPQSAILAVGAVRDEPVARDGQLEIATVMRVTLSVDHRPVDGETAARWLQALLSVLERPVQLLS